MAQVRRVYDPADATDGRRVLVDRVWPRGIRKDRLAAEWLPAVAPSTELRRWYGHDPERFAEFRTRYLAELAAPERAAALDDLRATTGALTLLTATKDVALSHASVLSEVLD